MKSPQSGFPSLALAREKRVYMDKALALLPRERKEMCAGAAAAARREIRAQGMRVRRERDAPGAIEIFRLW